MKELKPLIEKIKHLTFSDINAVNALILEFDALSKALEKSDEASRIDYWHYKAILIYSSVNFDTKFASKASSHNLSYEQICDKINILINAMTCYNKSILLKAASPKAKTFSNIEKTREARKACAQMIFEISSFI